MEDSQVKNRNIVKKRASLVYSINKFNAQELKFTLKLLATIRVEDEEFKRITYTKQELEEILGVQLNSSRLRTFSEGLSNKSAHVPRSMLDIGKEVADSEIEDDAYNWVSWFDKPGYSKGKINVKINDDLKTYLLNLKKDAGFISYNFGYVAKMKKVESIRIYEMLNRIPTGGRKHFMLNELHNILGSTKSNRAEYKEFNRSILKKAKEEINSLTDLNLNFVPVSKVGQKITEIAFIVNKNNPKIARENYINKEIDETTTTNINDYVNSSITTKDINGNIVNAGTIISINVNPITRAFNVQTENGFFSYDSRDHLAESVVTSQALTVA